MPNDAFQDRPIADDLLDLTERARARAGEDPFGNPVLAVALAITRLMDEGELTFPGLAALIRSLRDDAFAAELRGYLLEAVRAAGARVEKKAHLARPLYVRGLSWIAYVAMRFALFATRNRY